MTAANSSHEGLPARIVLDVRGDEERGYLVVTVGEDDTVRAWLTTAPHPRTGEPEEVLAIPLDLRRGEAIGDRLGPTEHEGTPFGEQDFWPEREETVGRARLGCLMAAISALFVVTLVYAAVSWMLG